MLSMTLPSKGHTAYAARHQLVPDTHQFSCIACNSSNCWRLTMRSTWFSQCLSRTGTKMLLQYAKREKMKSSSNLNTHRSRFTVFIFTTTHEIFTVDESSTPHRLLNRRKPSAYWNKIFFSGAWDWTRKSDLKNWKNVLVCRQTVILNSGYHNSEWTGAHLPFTQSHRMQLGWPSTSQPFTHKVKTESKHSHYNVAVPLFAINK